MSEWAGRLAVALLGLSGGVAVGSGLVALLVILDLIPRLAQLAKAYRQSGWFESAIVSGAMFWSFADFFDWRLAGWAGSGWLAAAAGASCGVFVGMLAGALTEVVNVLPILAKRLRLSARLPALVMAMVLGKLAGSLFDWLIFHR